MTLTNPDREAVASLELADARLVFVSRATGGNNPWLLSIGFPEETIISIEPREGGGVNYFPCQVTDCPERSKNTVHAHRSLGVDTAAGQLWVPREGGGVPAYWEDASGRVPATVIQPDFSYTEAFGELHISRLVNT